ncbi:MAG TPA: hypothetical protein VIS99_05515 [Terrimicrobiaceae bacterium]
MALIRCPHFDGGVSREPLEEACLSKITKEHLVNAIDDYVRMAVEDDGSAGASPIRIWEIRTLAMIEKSSRKRRP